MFDKTEKSAAGLFSACKCYLVSLYILKHCMCSHFVRGLLASDLLRRKQIVEADRAKIAQAITELDEKKNEALKKVSCARRAMTAG